MIFGLCLHSGVEYSIIEQSLSCDIRKCYWLGSRRPQRCYNEERLTHEPTARYICQQQAIAYHEEFCIIQDADIVQLDKGNFIEMKNFLAENEDYGAISIGGRTKDHNIILNHIGISCVMFRLDCLKNIVFTRSTKNACMCEDVTRSIRDINYKFNFLDNKIRVVERV